MKDKKDDRWEDFVSMLDDMKKHAQANDGAIIQADRPTQLKFGYQCKNTGKTWSISLVSIKKSLEAVSDQEKSLLLKTIGTLEGKENLLAEINKK